MNDDNEWREPLWSSLTFSFSSIMRSIHNAMWPLLVLYAVFMPESFGDRLGRLTHAFLMVFGVK